MQLHRDRNLGIEEVALPLPASLADQRRQMIGRKFLPALDGLESQPPRERVAGFGRRVRAE